MTKLGMTLEIELGVTGGEEDGVDNSGVEESSLYTKPEEVAQAYETLSKISPNFTIAAAFGNVHGVYKPGNVKPGPAILKNSQDYIAKMPGKQRRGILRRLRACVSPHDKSWVMARILPVLVRKARKCVDVRAATRSAAS